jgi:putative ABC transport system ATP-binding protein
MRQPGKSAILLRITTKLATDLEYLGGAEVIVERVSKSFGRGVDALHDVSLVIGPNEFVALEGPPGSGKSTLLNLVAGYSRPDSGSVFVAGTTPWEPRGKAVFRREVVGFVFQLHRLLPGLTAAGNVEVALLGAGVARAERQERAARLLEEAGVAHRAGHFPSELSGGERQCVAVARALANGPRLLLADEPTASLDDAAAARILDLFDRRRSERGMTVLAVSHDPAVAARADRALTLVGGELES